MLVVFSLSDKIKYKNRRGLPDSKLLSFASPKESSQRNGDPGLPPTSWVPCVARLVRRLRNSRYALKQSSPKSPDQSALLGGAQGKRKSKPKTTAWALRAHAISTLDSLTLYARIQPSHKSWGEIPSHNKRGDPGNGGAFSFFRLLMRAFFMCA